jgi:hypothetical protein
MFAALLQAEGGAYVDGARHLLERHAKRHNVAIGYMGDMGRMDGYALLRSKVAMVGPPVDEESVATLTHELAHCLNPPCPKSVPHLDVWHVSVAKKVRRCLQCEVDAWRTAFTLVSFTAAMRAFASECLRTYHAGAGSAEAHRAAQRIISGAAWSEEQQRRLDHELRMERVAAVFEMARVTEQELEPQRRERLRRHRQIEDIREAAKEAAQHARTL